MEENRPQAYMNPYLAGLILGATLLASFLVLGAGLGASAGLARAGAWMMGCCASAHVLASEYFGRWGTNPLRYYLTFMFVGVFLGGLFSAVLARRVKWELEKGARYPAKGRTLLALGGGIIVGFASRLASGCTSGQALSGSAMLLTGSLIFLVCVFAGGYGFAWFVRRQWND